MSFYYLEYGPLSKDQSWPKPLEKLPDGAVFVQEVKELYDFGRRTGTVKHYTHDNQVYALTDSGVVLKVGYIPVEKDFCPCCGRETCKRRGDR